MEETVQERVAKMLEALANGDSVELGPFGDQVVSTNADEEAAYLRECADAIRGGRPFPT